jgi:hypothetical protein
LADHLPLAVRQGKARRALGCIGWLAGLLFVLSSCGHSGPTSGPSVLKGTFTLWGVTAQPNPCAPRPGFTDVVSGARVAATDGHGRALSASSLGHPRSDPFHFGCVFTFTLKHLPLSQAYVIAVAHRDGLTYSYDDLARAGWRVALNLGSPPAHTP